MITDKQLQTVADVLNIPLSAILLRKALEAYEQSRPKPEPVAWMSPNKERLEFSRIDTVYGSHTIPLYTTPPTREPLTKHERFEIITQWDDETGLEELVLRVERAHGIGVKA